MVSMMIIPPLYSSHRGGSNGGLIIKIDKNVVYLLYNGTFLLIGDSTYVYILSIMQFSVG
jgi:hypothetical protein